MDDRIIIEHEGDPIRLQQLIPEDAQAYYDLMTYDIDHLSQYDDTITDKYPDAEVFKKSIENPLNPRVYRFGVWDSDTMVGGTNLTITDNSRAELGFWTGKQHTGYGYASKGLDLLMEFAFSNLGIAEVYCDIVAGNDTSIRLVEKFNFGLSDEFIDETNTRMFRYTLRKSIKE